MPTLVLRDGEKSRLSAKDFARFKNHRWLKNADGYVAHYLRIGKKATCVLLHRLVVKATKGQQVDHLNGDKLDNRRCNLRITSRTVNQLNSKLPSTNTSGYRGVTWNKRCKKWQSQFNRNGVFEYLGVFDDIKEAHEAYERAVRRYCRLSLPNRKVRSDSVRADVKPASKRKAKRKRSK